MTKDIEKRKRVESLLKNKNYELYEAVDGQTIEHKGCAKDWYEPFSHSHLTKGEIGCALTHYYLWEKIVKENIEKAIILEDDFDIKQENFMTHVESIPTVYI